MARRGQDAGEAAPPLLSGRGAGLALALGLALGWPMLATGGHLIFADTASYIRGGEIIARMASDLLLPEVAAPAPEAAVAPPPEAAPAPKPGTMTNERGQPYVVRSFLYSLYTLLAGAALWPAGFALLQAAMTLFLLFALVPRAALARPATLAAGAAAVGVLTTLPWFASYLMPDLLAAAVILWGAILVQPFDVLRPWQRLLLGAIAAFAVAAHYGHLPLGAGLFALALLWRVLARRLTLAALLGAALPVLFAPAANLAASAIALDAPSATPLRLPILLARSLEDGPARWYLEEACPEADLAFCRVFGEGVPDNIAAFLWREGGIDSLTPRQLAAIRAEEAVILARAFRAYPLAQTRSLLGNATEQVVKIGTGQIEPRSWEGGAEFAGPADEARASAVLRRFDAITTVATWAGAALLLALWLGGWLPPALAAPAALVVLGLFLNAGIFGGLSAPVDRYQSRVAWLLPALAAIALAARQGRGEPA